MKCHVFVAIVLSLAVGACAIDSSDSAEDLVAADQLSAASALAADNLGYLVINAGSVVVPTGSRVVSYTFSTPTNGEVSFAVSGASAASIDVLRGSRWVSAYDLRATRSAPSDAGVSDSAVDAGVRTTLSGTFRLNGTYRIVAQRPINTVPISISASAAGATHCVLGSTLDDERVGDASRFNAANAATVIRGYNLLTRTRIGTTVRFTMPPYVLAALPSNFVLGRALADALTDGDEYVFGSQTGTDRIAYQFHFHYPGDNQHGLIFRTGSSVPAFIIEDGDIQGCTDTQSP